MTRLDQPQEPEPLEQAETLEKPEALEQLEQASELALAEQPRTIVMIDSEIVQCKTIIDEQKARLKVLQKERRKWQRGGGDDAALAGRVNDKFHTANEDRLDDPLGSRQSSI